MIRRSPLHPALFFALALALAAMAGTSHAQENADPKDEKRVSGMSIVGNDEAPKSLVIVPWKSSQVGHNVDLSGAGGDGRQPVDRDVFLRELTYYEIRTATD